MKQKNRFFRQLVFFLTGGCRKIFQKNNFFLKKIWQKPKKYHIIFTNVEINSFNQGVTNGYFK